MVKQINEFTFSLPDSGAVAQTRAGLNAPQEAPQEMSVSLPTEETTIAIGIPAQTLDAKSISVYSSGLSPVSYTNEDNGIATFDIVFTVGILSESASRTYQIVKRIGLDKVKLANEAMCSSPVSIVENKKQEEKSEVSINESVQRARRLAGLS